MEDHELFGWVVFVIVALIPLFLIAGKLERKQGPEADSETLDAEKTPGTSAPHYRYAAIASTLAALSLRGHRFHAGAFALDRTDCGVRNHE